MDKADEADEADLKYRSYGSLALEHQTSWYMENLYQMGITIAGFGGLWTTGGTTLISLFPETLRIFQSEST